MQRRSFLALAATCLATDLTEAAVSDADAAAGIRAALERGAASAVDLLGRKDGFLANPKVHIDLPGFLKDASKLLRFTGQQSKVDDLVTAMNRAAEAAVPQAKTMLVAAARSISLGDARRIVTGGNDSVTRYFADKTRTPLSEQFLPIVKRETAKVGLTQRFDAVAGQVPGLAGKDANIESYVTGKALDGLYLVIGEEEKKIRSDPVGTGSALLAHVFGG
jgi:hypothetical protein